MGGASAAAVARGGGGGGPEEEPRDGRGGGEDAADAALLLERDLEATEDVRLGGGSKGAGGFVFGLALGGGGRSPL